MRLDGKVALITGGNSGIGRATAALFAEEGAAVVLTGRNRERGEQVAQAINDAGGKAMFIRADVRVAEDCRQAVEQTLERFGRIDVLFNNAGVYYPKTVLECTEEEWDETIDSSLKGAFLMSKYALPSMIERGSGSIIHNSSGWGILGGDRAAAYCAAKGGLVVMAKAMAIDHGRDGIRVNCVCPGPTDTPLMKEQPEKVIEALKKMIPLRRIAEPNDVANVIAFLCSREANYVTGQIVSASGGLTMVG